MKRNATISILIAIFLVSALFVPGCSFLSEKASEKAAEKAMEKAMESSGAKDAKVDMSKGQMEIKTGDGSMKIGGTYEWPSSLPSDVPKFTSGKITAVTENTTGDQKATMVMFENVAANAADAYKTALEGAGWKIGTVTKSADAYILSAEKDKRSVGLWLAADTSSSNKGISGWVSYSEKTK